MGHIALSRSDEEGVLDVFVMGVSRISQVDGKRMDWFIASVQSEASHRQKNDPFIDLALPIISDLFKSH